MSNEPARSGETLEQQRARDAWKACERFKEKHVNLAKGLPALVTGSGLMQTMAFLHERGAKDSQRHCRELGAHLRRWLHQRFETPTDFEGFMAACFEAKSATYQGITTEAFAWLRWLRQLAPARLSQSASPDSLAAK